MNVSDRQRLAQLVAANVRDLRIVADRNAEIVEILGRLGGLTTAAISEIRRSYDPDAVLAARYGAPVDVIRSVR